MEINEVWDVKYRPPVRGGLLTTSVRVEGVMPMLVYPFIDSHKIYTPAGLCSGLNT